MKSAQALKSTPPAEKAAYAPALPMSKMKEITKPVNACYVRNSYIGKIKQETIQNSFGFLNLFL